MKFIIPDAGGVFQEVEISDGRRAGDLEIKILQKEEVDSVLDRNGRLRNTGVRTYLGKGDNTSMVLIGSLSALQAHLLMQEGTFWDDNKLRGWLKDLDNHLWGVLKGTTDRSFYMPGSSTREANA